MLEYKKSPMINLLTIPQAELETLIQSWGHQKFRASQILHWVRKVGVTSFDEMVNLPKRLRLDLKEFASIGSLELAIELKS